MHDIKKGEIFLEYTVGIFLGRRNQMTRIDA